MTLLTVQSLGQRPVISENGELSSLQHETEVTHCKVDGQDLPVKGTVPDLRRQQLSAEEGEGGPGPLPEMLENNTNMGGRGVDGQRQMRTRHRVL